MPSLRSRTLVLSCVQRAALALALTGVAACSGDRGTDAAPAATAPARPIAGQQKGAYFYPKYQRWRIVEVKPNPKAKLPPDLRGIPALIRGQVVHLSASYLAIPSPSADGNQLSPVCWRWRGDHLIARFVDRRDGAPQRRITFMPAPDRHLTATLDGQFDLTLERLRPVADGGYERRQLDATFNLRQSDLDVPGRNVECELRAVALPTLKHSPLELVATESGRRVTVPDAVLDLETPLMIGNLSTEWRRSLNPDRPGGTIRGCRTDLEIGRLRTGLGFENRRAYEHTLFTKAFGTYPDGETCGRLTMMRRIDPARILALYDISGQHPGALDSTHVPMRFETWLDSASFRVNIAGSVFRIHAPPEPRLLISLINRASDPPAPSPYAYPAHTRSMHAPDEAPPAASPAMPPAPSSRGSTIHRWVDAQGVVHYSDHPQGE